MTGGAVAKYEWSLNGTVMATTATYEVPASAKDGDEIKLTVTAEDGETASDTVYVGGLTILKVEPLAQSNNSYKYVKAFFSSALSSLSPSEIEIRGKKDQKLYSIQTAVLSTDGMAADLTLYGNNDSDLTTFLQPHTAYIMTLTQNGQSTSLEFELPVFATDKIVTSVDTTKNKITVASAIRTGESWTLYDFDNDGNLIAYDNATFNVAGKYDGNLGTLIGRTVNFQFDTDYNLTAFSLDEAEVVYGAMQYVNDNANNDLKDGYYKDKITGKKYKNSVTTTSTKNVTKVFEQDGDFIGYAPLAETTYNYTKLVLNPDGTVSTAFILEELPISLFVTEVDGTKAIQDKNNGVDLDGYTIVKDDEYIAPADLEFGDVVFVNATEKFADVYNNMVSGEISNVISGKLDIDDTTYNWNGAQYYDDGDDVYKKLSTAADKDEASQNYLNSLDPDEDTTIWLNRKGDIVYIDGTETGVVKTTDVTYLVVETAETYTESLKDMIKVKVFDGSAKSDLVLNIADLKYYNGDAGSCKAKEDWTLTRTGTLQFKPDGGAFADVDTIDNLIKAGELIAITYNDDDKAIGLKDAESTEIAKTGTASTATLDDTNKIYTAASPNLSKDTKMVTTTPGATTDHKWSVGSYTNLWIWNVNGANDDKYSKVTVTDFKNEILTTDDGKLLSLAYRADGTKATDLVVKIASDAAYKEADNNAIFGMYTGSTKKNNSDNNKQVVNTISIIGTDGEKATYEADGTLLPAAVLANAGDYVELTQNKETEKISAVTVRGNWQYATTTVAEDTEKGYLLKARAYDSEKLVLSDNKELTVAEGGVILKRYNEEGSVKHKVVTYSDVNTIKSNMKVWYDNTYLDSTGQKIQSAMIVVEATEAAVPAATLALTSLTTHQATLTGTIGTVTVTPGATGLTYTLYSKAAGATTPTAETATITVDGGDLKIGAPFALHADTYYWVAAEVPTGSAFDNAYSNELRTETALLSGLGSATSETAAVNFTSGACTTGGVFTGGTSTIFAYDQYGDKFVGDGTTPATLTLTGDTTVITDASYTIDANGKLGFTVTGVDVMAAAKAVTATLGGETLTIEVTTAKTTGTGDGVLTYSVPADV